MLLAEAGLAPITRRSGASSGVRFRLAANHHLRDAFTWWAFNSLKSSALGADALRRRTWARPALLSRATRRRGMLGTGALALLAGLDALRAQAAREGHGRIAPATPAFALEGGAAAWSRTIAPARLLSVELDMGSLHRARAQERDQEVARVAAPRAETRATGGSSTTRLRSRRRALVCSRSPPTTAPLYPAAMAVIERDLDGLVCQLRFPAAHRKRIRRTDESVKWPAAPPVGESRWARG